MWCRAVWMPPHKSCNTEKKQQKNISSHALTRVTDWHEMIVPCYLMPYPHIKILLRDLHATYLFVCCFHYIFLPIAINIVFTYLICSNFILGRHISVIDKTETKRANKRREELFYSHDDVYINHVMACFFKIKFSWFYFLAHIMRHLTFMKDFFSPSSSSVSMMLEDKLLPQHKTLWLCERH
jgi:hypothetical protein